MTRGGLKRLLIAGAAVGAAAGIATSSLATTRTHTRLGPVTTDFRSYPSCPGTDRRPLTSTTPGAGTMLVPGRPAQVLLCRYRGLNPEPSQSIYLAVQRSVVDQQTVHRLAAELDALAPLPPGSYSCPADFGVKIIAIFKYSGNKSDDPVTVDPNGCTSATNGHQIEAALSPPGAALINQLETLTR